MRTFLNHLNLLLRLLCHSLLYTVIYLWYGLLHPRLNVIAQGEPMCLKLLDSAREANSTDHGMDLDELDDLLAACEEKVLVGFACSGIVRSIPQASSNVSSKFSLSVETFIWVPLRGDNE